jgi:predicted flap endonuclease-1-like 5' DNA nuclease
MNSAVKNLLRVAGVIVGLGAAAWALRDRMLPPPEIHVEPPPKFRTGGGADDLTLIKGVGPVYRDRLAEAGIHSFSDLGGRGASDIAEIAGTSAAVAQGWVKSAQSLVS